MLSTDSVLRDKVFEWLYDLAFPPFTRLNNTSGISNPLALVYVGGCAGYSVGVSMNVYDSAVEGTEGIQGAPVEDSAPGEMVATAAFPNIPMHFWEDDSKKKYHDAYLDQGQYFLKRVLRQLFSQIYLSHGVAILPR